MVQHVGTSYHSYGDDVVRKLTDVCEVFRILNHFGLHKLSHEFPQEGGNFILQVSYPWLICLKHRFEVFQGLEDEGDVLGCTGGPLGCWDMCHSASPIQPSLHPHAGLANGAANHSHTLLQVLQCFGILMGSVSVNPRTPYTFLFCSHCGNGKHTSTSRYSTGRVRVFTSAPVQRFAGRHTQPKLNTEGVFSFNLLTT